MPQVISSVKALLKHQDKYLFLREPLHKGEIWDLPGGKIEYGEEPEQALHREVKEELNIEISIVNSVGLWWFFSQNSRHQVVCHTFLCEPVGQFEIDLTKNPADEDIAEYRWLSIEEALSSPTIELAPSLRQLLQKLG